MTRCAFVLALSLLSQLALAGKPAPANTADDELSIQLAAVPYRVEQVELLKKLIKLTTDPTSPDLPDYYFRLGELYASQLRVYRLRSIEAEIKGDKAGAAKAAETAHQFMID